MRVRSDPHLAAHEVGVLADYLPAEGRYLAHLGQVRIREFERGQLVSDRRVQVREPRGR